MSLDFVEWPVVWVPAWALLTALYVSLLLLAQRELPSKLENSVRHARIRVEQAALTLLWGLFSLQWGPGNLLPGVWEDLVGVLAVPVIGAVMIVRSRTSRKFDELEKREAEVLSSEKSTVE